MPIPISSDPNSRPKPKLLIAHFRHDIVSGAEHSIGDLLSYLKGEFDFVMLIPREGKLAEYYRKMGYRVWIKEVQNYRRLLPGLHTLQSIRLARQLKKMKINVILCNTFPAASRVSTAARYAGIPYAVYIREFISDKPIHRRLLDKASYVFVISKSLQAFISQLTSPNRVRLTYNNINPTPILQRVNDHRDSGTRLLPFGPEHPVVGLVGRIAPFKQQDIFVRAVPLVLKEVPSARFAIIGAATEKNQPYEQQVKDLTAQLGVQAEVAFLGNRADNIELTSELAVTCLTSTREPLGRVILEGYLVGVPVVASQAGGAAELVDGEITGLQFDSTAPDAPAQLAAQIVRLLKDPELGQRLVQAGREKAFATFAGAVNVWVHAKYIRELCVQHQNGQHEN